MAKKKPYEKLHTCILLASIHQTKVASSLMQGTPEFQQMIDLYPNKQLKIYGCIGGMGLDFHDESNL